jgi:hypothetical protein
MCTVSGNEGQRASGRVPQVALSESRAKAALSRKRSRGEAQAKIFLVRSVHSARRPGRNQLAWGTSRAAVPGVAQLGAGRRNEGAGWCSSATACGRHLGKLGQACHEVQGHAIGQKTAGQQLAKAKGTGPVGRQ